MRQLYNSKSVAIAIILIVSFCVYANTIPNEFVYDDENQVLDNPWIKDVRNIPEIFFSNVWAFIPELHVSNYYRPLMHLIYMAEYHIFGLKPWGWHLVNIIFHAINGIMVFLIAVTLLNKTQSNTQKYDYKTMNFALIAAIFFAIHPVNTEVVAWVSAVPELSFTLFYLISFYLYINCSVGSKNHIIAIILFFLAAISKETALTLPILLFIYDYAFRKDSIKTFNDYLKRYLPFAIVSVAYILIRIYALSGFAPSKNHPELNTSQYLINIFPLFIQYLEKLILPINLNAFHVLHPVYSVLGPRFIISLMLTFAFFMFVILIKRANNTVFFTLSWIFIPLLPTLYIPVVGEATFAERYLYLPSIGFVILMSITIEKIYQIKLFEKAAIPIAISIFIALTGLYSTGTVKRNYIWRDNYTLWQDTVEKSPDGYMPHYNLGNIYKEKRLLEKAIYEYQAALKIKPDYADARINLAVVYQGQGKFEDALREYQDAIALGPELAAPAYFNLGNLHLQYGHVQDAISAYKTAIGLAPDFVEPYLNLGTLYRNMGLFEDAITQYREILKRTSLAFPIKLKVTHQNLGSVFGERGLVNEAISEYKEAVELDPNDGNSWYNLGVLYSQKGLLDEAVNAYSEALRIKPNDSEAIEGLNKALHLKQLQR